MKSKRISFDETAAKHIYEFFLALKQGVDKYSKDERSKNEICGCGEDIYIKKRLEEFLGKKEVAYFKKIVKKNPYFK